MERLQEIVTAVRVIRGEMNVPPAKKIQVKISASSPDIEEALQRVKPYLMLLCCAETLEIGQAITQPAASGSAVTADAEIYVPLEGLIDLDAERKRLEKEIQKFIGLLKGLDAKLSNEKFTGKAPAEVVERERQRQGEYRVNVAKLNASLILIGK